MFARNTLIAIAAMVATAGAAAAQATGTASFNAPYRAFQNYEFGGTVSFNDNDVVGLEGQLRFGYQKFDIGFRGGVGLNDFEDAILVGVEGRGRVLTHNEQFPLDGALVVGFGMSFDGGTFGNIPVGLSLGRRVDIENSQISIVPYIQPTGNMVFIDTPDGPEFGFSLGFGLDARLSRFFDARVSAGFGTDWGIEGFAISAVWIR
jgi:opacity protein-like surface antigen